MRIDGQDLIGYVEVDLYNVCCPLSIARCSQYDEYRVCLLFSFMISVELGLQIISIKFDQVN